MRHVAARHAFLPFSNIERLINRYPHLTLFISGLFGAILLLFFLWLTLFFGLPPARAQGGILEPGEKAYDSKHVKIPYDPGSYESVSVSSEAPWKFSKTMIQYKDL